MTRVEKKYIEFKKNENKTWLDKMIWCKGQKIFNTGSIDKFIRETNPFTPETVVKTVDDYFNFINKLSDKFGDWAREKDNNFKNDDFVDMKKFFKGFFGEYFCYRIAEDTTRLLSQNELYCVRCMSPNLIGEDDNGIDFTAIINDKPCVIQVKWWNRWVNNDNEFLSIKTFQSLASEGAMAGYITLTEQIEKNMYFIWLDSEDKAYNIINKNPRLKGRVVVFGRETWDFSINGRDKLFWSGLWDNINSLAQM
jgi:hypothetical protein